MPGLVPGIHVFSASRREDVDGRDKPGHDKGKPPMTKQFRTLDDVDVSGRRVLLRVDLNVPAENGRVTDATRLERVAPTITEMARKGGKVILLSHFGRPKGPDPKQSLRPVAEALAGILGQAVGFAGDCVGEKA